MGDPLTQPLSGAIAPLLVEGPLLERKGEGAMGVVRVIAGAERPGIEQVLAGELPGDVDEPVTQEAGAARRSSESKSCLGNHPGGRPSCAQRPGLRYARRATLKALQALACLHTGCPAWSVGGAPGSP